MSKIISLDVGEKRVGVAYADDILRTAYPLITLQNDETIISQILEKVKSTESRAVVVGQPRNNSGEITAQTIYVENFVENLRKELPKNAEIYFQDESLTSVKAQEFLDEIGRPYKKEDIDSLAAAIILQDYLNAGGKI